MRFNIKETQGLKVKEHHDVNINFYTFDDGDIGIEIAGILVMYFFKDGRIVACDLSANNIKTLTGLGFHVNGTNIEVRMNGREKSNDTVLQQQ